MKLGRAPRTDETARGVRRSRRVARLCACLSVACALTVAATSAVAEGPQRKKRTDARAIARKMKDDVQCLRAIKNLAYRSKKSAFVLLRACAEQGKFRSISFLLQPPYVDYARALKRGTRLRFISKLLAVRGANLRNDIPRLASGGLDITALPEALRSPQRYRGRAVIFIGHIEKRTRSRGSNYTFEISELRSATEDRRRTMYVDEWGRRYSGREKIKVGSVDRLVPSDWVVYGKSKKLFPEARGGRELVFLAVFNEVKSEENMLAEVKLVEAYPRGFKMPDF